MRDNVKSTGQDAEARACYTGKLPPPSLSPAQLINLTHERLSRVSFAVKKASAPNKMWATKIKTGETRMWEWLGRRFRRSKKAVAHCGRSIAIWGEAPQTFSPSEEAAPYIKVHFNYWHVKSQKSNGSESDFFDIGLMAYRCSELQALRIFVPLALSLNDVEDLGEKFRSPNVASIVFNESLQATTGTGVSANYTELTQGNDEYVRAFAFTKNGNGIPLTSELTVSQGDDGMIISIGQAAIATGFAGLGPKIPLYFRIRVRVGPEAVNPFSRIIKPSDSWLLSSFDYAEFLDFRLNEARNLPHAIANKMAAVGEAYKTITTISRVDFLVIVGESADIIESVECNKKRLLESELWGEYTKTSKGWNNELSDGMVIYHWKKLDEKSIGDFSAFMKIKIRRSNISLAVRYLICVALIGCLGSLVASVVWYKFGPDGCTPTKIEEPKIAGEQSISE